MNEESFLSKHKPLTAKQITERLEENEKSKQQYSHDMADLEQNLKDFSELTDPIVVRGKPLCWVKRPAREEFEALVPPELKKYRNDPKGVPPELANKYEDNVYLMMEKLIVEPKHDSTWWKANSPLIFIPLFQAHLNGIYELVGIDVANF